MTEAAAPFALQIPCPQRQWKLRCSEAGLLLFDRTTGLNVLLDEVSIPASLWSRAPRHVSIALSNRCDLSCAHCFAPKSRDELPYESVTGWLAELDAHGALGVGFGGGEPTLYQTDDGRARVEVRFGGEIAWLSLGQMAEPFQRDASVISRRIKNAFDEGELCRESVVAELAASPADRGTHHEVAREPGPTRDVPRAIADLEKGMEDASEEQDRAAIYGRLGQLRGQPQ